MMWEPLFQRAPGNNGWFLRLHVYPKRASAAFVDRPFSASSKRVLLLGDVLKRRVPKKEENHNGLCSCGYAQLPQSSRQLIKGEVAQCNMSQVNLGCCGGKSLPGRVTWRVLYHLPCSGHISSSAAIWLQTRGTLSSWYKMAAAVQMKSICHNLLRLSLLLGRAWC